MVSEDPTGLRAFLSKTSFVFGRAPEVLALGTRSRPLVVSEGLRDGKESHDGPSLMVGFVRLLAGGAPKSAGGLLCRVPQAKR